MFCLLTLLKKGGAHKSSYNAALLSICLRKLSDEFMSKNTRKLGILIPCPNH